METEFVDETRIEELEEAGKYISQFIGLFNDVVRDKLQDTLQDEQLGNVFNAERMEQMLSDGVSADPGKLLRQQMDLFKQQMTLWQQTSMSLLGVKNEPVISESKGDARFQDAAWSEHPLFSFLKQSYLLNCDYLNRLVDELQFKDQKIADQVRFGVRQFASSLSPTNFAATNPEVYRKTIESKGQNLVKGLSKFIDDLANSPPETFSITQTDLKAFKVGVDLANTPGKVVFQNSFMQLIQYTPVTETVYRRPVLIIPAIINKFYIMDLGSEKSLVKWMLEHGFTVFMISWVNPNEKHRDIAFEDYVIHGPVTAIDVINKATGEASVNAVGYCIGGTILAATQAYMAGQGDHRIRSATYLASLLDFSNPGELGVYISEDMLHSVEKDVAKKGYFDGRRMAMGFSLLRENNLFWSCFVTNYLKGEDPMAHDMLFWNADATNFPEKACQYYLRNMYMENRLVEPGGISVRGVPLDLRAVRSPAYFISTEKDHIAPWQGTYLGGQSLGGDVRFVLAGSGHIAGVINPPVQNKYGYRINESLDGDAESWYANAQQRSGSWWNDWFNWVEPLSGIQVKARDPQHGILPIVEDAPGSYVQQQC